MLIGQSVIAPTTGATYYTPWFPRGADSFVAVIEVLRSSSSANLTFTCAGQTKNNEETDQAATTFTSFTVTSTAGAVSRQLYAGSKELVRYKFTVTGTGATQWVHFRSNSPIWQRN